MIRAGSRNHKLIFGMRFFNESYPVFHQNFGVDKSGLVAHEFGAAFEVFVELSLHVLFELAVVPQIDAVPKLVLPRVQVVDAVQVVVFLMPPEHSLPRSCVNVRVVYTRYFLVCESLPIQMSLVNSQKLTPKWC